MEPKNAPSSILERTQTRTLSLSLSLFLLFPPPRCIDVRAKGSRWDVGIGKNVGDAGTCFDLPEKGLCSRFGGKKERGEDTLGEGRRETGSPWPKATLGSVDDPKVGRKGRS